MCFLADYKNKQDNLFVTSMSDIKLRQICSQPVKFIYNVFRFITVKYCKFHLDVTMAVENEQQVLSPPKPCDNFDSPTTEKLKITFEI